MKADKQPVLFARRVARPLSAEELGRVSGAYGSTYSGAPVYAQDCDQDDQYVSIPGRD